MVFATVSWRPDTLYSGGLDPVVMAKALLALVALTVAWNAHEQRNTPQPIRTLPVWFLLAYLGIATFGAWSTGDMFPSFVLAVRVLILGLIVLALARSFPAEELVRSWFSALITVALLSAVTGLPSLASGRLRGGIPPLHPNELATLCGLASIGVCWLVLQDRARGRHVFLLVVLLGLVWASGSRTSLAAVMLGFVVMLVQARRLNRSSTVGVAFAAGALVYVSLATDVFGSFFGRGGSESITTLSSRTIAWSAAFSYSDSAWVRLMGAGLAKKEIPVVGQYWETQVLDSSWISALVHAGRVGMVLLAVWFVWTFATSLTGPRDRRMLFTGLLAYLLMRSFLESGLVDSSTAFITFFMVSVLAGATPKPLLK